jgi:hypothetical protein
MIKSAVCLCNHDRSTEYRARIAQLQERQQVHPLVLGLLQQRVDPAVVAVHVTEGAHMAKHARSLQKFKQIIAG